MDRTMTESNLALVTDGADKPEVFLKRAGDAIADAVAATLRGGEDHRFAAAGRLCQIGQSIVAAGSRVGDVAYANGGNMADPYGVPIQMRRNGGDEQELLRNIMLTVDKMTNANEGKDAARIALDETRELLDLQELRNKLPLREQSPIHARITKLLANMEARNEAVPADVARGHLTGEAGGQGDADAGLRNVGVREAGAGDAARACHAEDVGPHALG
jgi:hypothetical protein